MARVLVAGGALAAFACLLALAAFCSDAESLASRGAPAVVRVTVTAQGVTVARDLVRAGPVVLQVGNGTGAPHELQIRHFGDSEVVLGKTGEIAAGASGSARFTLEPGRYVLVCDLDGAYDPGLRAVVTAY